ncbi:hypothetical protein [uncultured Gammaproteobacteria bacterium]|nr:hypothetical protein [uncultured Gammaproteobacteria bacterium]
MLPLWCKSKEPPFFLLNYRLAMLEIQDASMVKLSGETHHPIALPSPSDTMLGLM